MPWWLAAILSALFASMVGVLAKAGFGSEATKISSNLGTAIRMLVVFPLAWLIVAADGSFSQLGKISQRQWVFLLLSGLGTGLSWLFYFFAISKGEVNRVNPIDKASLAISFILAVIFLGEKITWQTTTATLLVLAALFITLLGSKTPAKLAETLPGTTASQSATTTSQPAAVPPPTSAPEATMTPLGPVGKS